MLFPCTLIVHDEPGILFGAKRDEEVFVPDGERIVVNSEGKKIARGKILTDPISLFDTLILKERLIIA